MVGEACRESGLVAAEPDIAVRAYQIHGRSRRVALRHHPFVIDIIAAGRPGRNDLVRRKDLFGISGQSSRHARFRAANQQQNTVVFREEFVEPPRRPIARRQDRRVGGPITRGRSGSPTAMIFDNRAVAVIDRNARYPFPQSLLEAGEPG